MQGLSLKLWNQVVDLAFDCFCVANVSRSRFDAQTLKPLKVSADFLLLAVRRGLKVRRSARENRGEQIRNFLIEIRQELMVANGLGALGQKAYETLDRRTGILFQNFCHPSVRRLLGELP